VSSSFDGTLMQMAQPSVRKRAMADKNQQQVWDSVRSSQSEAAQVVGGAMGSGVGAGNGGTRGWIVGSSSAPAAAPAEVLGTTSYAKTMENKDVQKEVDKIAAPVARDYSHLIRELKDRKAVGVVAAVNGEIVWADVFASTALLEKYWPKLVRSYAAEALVPRASRPLPDVGSAQQFLDSMEGRRQVSETEPGVFRQTEIFGEGYRVFELTSLLPKTGFDLHLAKTVE